MSQSVELQKTFWYTCGKFGIAPWRGVAVVLIENRVRRIGQMGIWLNAGEQQVGVKQMATKNAVPRRTFRVGCPHVMRHIVLTALLVLSFRTMATIRYEYLDNSQRVEIVPSQGDGSISTGFWSKLMDVQRSVAKWLSMQRGFVLIFR